MAGTTTDTVNVGVPENYFVVKRGSSILNKDLLDSILTPKSSGSNTKPLVPTIMTPEERIVTEEDVNKYGINFFREINNSSDNAAHSNIDALIALSQLNNMQNMAGGGEVVQGYENGDMVEPSTVDSIFFDRQGGNNPLTASLIQSIGGMEGVDKMWDYQEQTSPTKGKELLYTESDGELMKQPSTYSGGILPGARTWLSQLIGERKVDELPPEFEALRQSKVEGYQDGEQVVDPNDPLGITQRMANPSVYEGSVISGAGGGVDLDTMAQNQVAQDIDAAMQVMEEIKLQGVYNEPEGAGAWDWKGEVPQEKAEEYKQVFSILRDLENQKAYNQMLMKAGRMGGAVRPQQGLFFKPK